jgi:hypothetical protein
MRQPKWTLDEVILAVNAYFEIGDVGRFKVIMLILNYT